MAEHTLVTPLLDEHPKYALGVEFGMLFREMKDANEIKGYYLRQNQDQILLLASRRGWKVNEILTYDRSWFYLDMEKI